MTRFIAILLGAISPVWTGTVLAQQTAPGAAKSDHLVRIKHSQSKNMPVEIAFLGTLRFLYGVNQNRSDMAVAFVKRGMRLDQIEAEEFLALLLNTHDSIMAGIRDRKYDVACSGSTAKVVGTAIYTTLEAMDDVSEHVAAVQLHKLRAEIGPDKVSRLERWLDKQKRKISEVRYNRKELHTSRGESPEWLAARLAESCAAWAADRTGDHQ